MQHYLLPLALLISCSLAAQYRGGHGSGAATQAENFRTLGGSSTGSMYRGGTGRGDRMAVMSNEQQILPLTLLSFTAQLAGNTVVLAWTTAEERDVSHFTLTRSADGRRFAPVGSLPARGGATPTTYHYTDYDPLPDRSYYRLRSEDLDGTADYSDIVPVDRDAATGWTMAVSPNPTAARQPVRIQLQQLPAAQAYTLQLLDPSGRLVRQRTVRMDGPSADLQLSTRGLAGGLYTIQLLHPDGVQRLSHKLTVTP